MDGKKALKAGLAATVALWFGGVIGNTGSLYMGAYDAHKQAARNDYPPALQQEWRDFARQHEEMLGMWKQLLPLSVLSLGTGPQYLPTQEEYEALSKENFKGTRTEELEKGGKPQ